jgi:hypothetical protein
VALKRTANGLILREDFSSLSSWSGAGWSSVADPTLVAFDPAPILALSPSTAGSADYDGIREPQLYVEGGIWTLLYDGGDDTHGWTQFTATSTDRGLTWAKNGTQSIAYADGAGGTHAAVATGWLEKRGSTYYLYRVTANAIYANPIGQGLPAGPYFGDIWTASSLTGPWSFLRAFPTAGSGWAAGQNLPGSVYFDGTTYHFFNEGFNGTIGRYFGTSIGGVWTEDATQIAGFQADGRYFENPKVFYHSGLARYIMLGNGGIDQTDQNALWSSPSLTNWSLATMHRIQHASPLDSPNVVGVMAHVTGPDGALISEADGSLPVVYDGLPRGNAGYGWHVGRHIQYAVLEPAANCARYTHLDTTPRRITRTLAHTDFVAEWTVELRSINASFGSIIFEFRRQDDSNYYRLVLHPTEGLRLDVLISGAYTVLGMLSSPTEVAAANLVHRIRLVVTGTHIQAWLNGEAQIDLRDSTYASGNSIAFMGDDCDGDVRLFSLRNAQTVAINGVQSGQVVTLRGAGGIPIATTTATSSSVTLTAPHFPLVSFDVNGTTYTPSGNIWGGDTYAINASPLPMSFG